MSFLPQYLNSILKAETRNQKQNTQLNDQQRNKSLPTPQKCLSFFHLHTTPSQSTFFILQVVE